MKKLLISLCCVLTLISLVGCNNKKATKEAASGVTKEAAKEATKEAVKKAANETGMADKGNSAEAAKADITNLFIDIQEIESVVTMRIDIQYTLKTKNQIKELVELLKNIEYTEYEIDSTDGSDPEKPKATGSSTSGINLSFYYKDGSGKSLELSSTEEGEIAEYSEVSYEPYMKKSKDYITDKQVWNDVLKIMLRGERKDLNEKQ